MARIGAALVAIICWAGLAAQLFATYGQHHNLIVALWIIARFFTILANLAVAVTMTSLAAGRRVSPQVLGGVTLAILLVGVIYWLLLQGLHVLTGLGLVADVLLHKVSPVLMVAWWLLFAPRAKLRWNAPLWWSIYPFAYLVYALARGQIDQKYPYPFLDVGKLGWIQTIMNVGGIALGFILAGYALVWIDRWRPLGSGRSSR